MATREELLQAMRVIKGHCELIPSENCEELCPMFLQCTSCPNVWYLEDGEPNE